MNVPRKLRRRLVPALALALAAGTTAVAMAPAKAVTEVQFPVMNTSEQPPDGVYFRNSPASGNTDRIYGVGVFAGEHIAVDCWTQGEAVGRYGNTTWYHGRDVERPMVGNWPNVGYLNTHYVDDGLSAGQHDGRLPQCGTSAPEPFGGASLYYSPFPGDWVSGRVVRNHIPYKIYIRSHASTTLYKNDWLSSCNTSRYSNYPHQVAGQTVTTASGWSGGRLGPIGLLRDYPTEAGQIHYVLLFDPGTYSQLKGDCSSDTTSRVLLEWLQRSPSNQLTILAGETTRDAVHPSYVGGKAYYHRGLQDVYFPKIRGTAQAKQVTVCNYDHATHLNVWWKLQDWQNQAPITSACPTLDGQAANALWHP